MDEEVDFLLLGPFSDIVEKAQTAAEAAEHADDAAMLKAAQGLAKEGERARKAIEPVVRRQLTLYGVNFVAALKDHDGIAEHIDALNELVYVFDDFTEVETFDAEKFMDLGKRAQQAALRITPMLKRMKLEVPASQPTSPPPAPPAPPAPPLTVSTPSTPSLSPVSPVVTPGFARVNSVTGRRSIASTSGGSATGSPRPDTAKPFVPPRIQESDTVVHGDDPGVVAQLVPSENEPIMGIQGGPDLGWNGGVQSPTAASVRSESRLSMCSTSLAASAPEPPPPEPTTNPWQIGVPSPMLDENSGANSIHDGVVLVRRPRVSSQHLESSAPSSAPMDPGTAQTFVSANFAAASASSSASVSGLSQSVPRRLDDGVDAWQRQLQEEERRLSGSTSVPPPPPYSVGFERPSSAAAAPPPISPVWPLQPQQPQQQPALHGPGYAPSSVSPRQSRMSTATTTTTASTSTVSSAANGSVFGSDQHANNSGGQLLEAAHQSIEPSPSLAYDPILPRNESAPRTPVAPFPPENAPNPAAAFVVQQPHAAEQPGLEPVQHVVNIDSGLIPVRRPSAFSSIEAPAERIIHPRSADCNIGPGSSFHLLKGFCEGAREVQRGGAGVRQIKKLSYSGAGAYAAKCKYCFYELQWAEVEKDRQNQPSANYRMHGIGFRLRFLSKSHLPAKQVDDPLYACLFCLQEGRTLEESDATVFFTQNQLFAHLARHPRPLPEVPGVTVIDGSERPPEIRHNYDLHFTMPPANSEMEGIRRELLQLPTATAVETFRKSHGALRRPFDGAPPIQFPAGSKIIGIEFPAKYKGEWAVGWFDNVRGPFPVEHVRLDTPPRNEIRTQGTSALRATARWKWASGSAYRNTEWLRLDKNETVSNIVWSHPEHWCWAGTNSRGKWGYFPQSHIEPNSLKESQVGSDAASIASYDRAGSSNNGGGGGFLSRLRSHNNHSNSSALRRPISIMSTSTSSSR
ncbi:sh3 domain containing protein [Niveomyces insectorum RCEF 264]|uniref:Sh3 domain containing protein n=1 Tax=Niveomyces insectorum RCEF 264 TaxID=1081102 RepID=A0A168A8U0_9HYPO|nr:sh3 domain containing protein [Niveomyces insectorum RCEF 264]